MKKKLFATRFLLLVLSLATVLTVFVGCQTEDDGANNAANEGEVTGNVSDELIPDAIPEDLKFNKTVKILGSKAQAYHYMSEALSEDVINNVIYNRNETVEERLGIDMSFILEPGSFTEKDTFVQLVDAQNQAGTPYDAIICYNLLPYAMAMKGLCDNLYDTPYIDLSAPWWPQSYLETGVYENQIFGLVESCGYGTLERMICTFFNEELVEDYKMESPYDLVAKNEWTFDKLLSMTKDTYRDLNTDTTGKDPGDFFGFCAGGTAPMLDSWFFALGNRYSQVNGDGDLELLLGKPSVNDFFEKFNVVFESDDNILNDAKHTQMFTSERAIFYNTIVGMTSSLKDTEIIYGVVPTPKATAEQDYYTHLGNTHEAWCIPTDVADMDCSSALLECMASESYRQTNPVYFESQLKLRLAQDERIADMYDLIREKISFDFCYLYAVAFTDTTRPNYLISQCITNPTKKNWSSVWGANKTSVEEQFNKIVNSYFD